MASEVELQGVDQMLASISSKLASGIYRMENVGLREAGKLLAEAQREEVVVSDVNHVHIKDDIKVSNVRRGDGIRYILVGPGKITGWRAHFTEYGTSETDAKPFVYPALHKNKNTITRLLAAQQRQGMIEG